ncbi:MAG: ribonuclease P protein component [Polyangiales bacterium]
MRLAPTDRLRKRFEFRRLRDQGRRVHTRSFVLIIAPAEQSQPRLGITVSRQVGKAVRRNRVKRLVREVFRQHRDLLPPASDLVVIARAGCRIDSASEVADELMQASVALGQACRRGPSRRGPRPGGRP